MLTIVIPTYNEATHIQRCLLALQDFRHQGHEIILADGGSKDATTSLAADLCDQIIVTKKGRGRQMNAGAAASQGDQLLFLHADTRLPANAAQHIQDSLLTHNWGFFNVHLNDKRTIFRVIETLMNWRSRLSHIASGDQCLFIRKHIFKAINGYPDIAIMEDIGISKRLKLNRHRPAVIRSPANTSCRRWQQNGILATIGLMWQLRLYYYLGANPAQLAKRYP